MDAESSDRAAVRRFLFQCFQAVLFNEADSRQAAERSLEEMAARRHDYGPLVLDLVRRTTDRPIRVAAAINFTRYITSRWDAALSGLSPIPRPMKMVTKIMVRQFVLPSADLARLLAEAIRIICRPWPTSLEHSLDIILKLKDPFPHIESLSCAGAYEHAKIACFKTFTALYRVHHVKETPDQGPANAARLEHRVYLRFAKIALSSRFEECMKCYRGMSDHYGMIFEVKSNLCVITELRFFFSEGDIPPSPLPVVVRMGRCTSSNPSSSSLYYSKMFSEFSWTYESRLTRSSRGRPGVLIFTLPSPVLCVGGIVAIQCSSVSGQYYTVNPQCYVGIMGRNLGDAFKVEFQGDSDRFVLESLTEVEEVANEEGDFTADELWPLC